MQEKYHKYAHLLLTKGLCINEFQPLLINAPITAIEFVRILTEEACKLNIRDIYYDWQDEELKYIQLKNFNEEEIKQSRFWNKTIHDEFECDLVSTRIVQLLSVDDFELSVDYLKYIHEYLKDYTDPKILEVGAGTGRYCCSLASEGYDVSAIELVKNNLGVLKAKKTTVKAYQGNAVDLKRFKNATFDIVLLLGPMLEEKYGSKRIIQVIVIIALVTGIINYVFFVNIALCGASGVCFAFILLSSFTSFKEGEIPLTFLLVAAFFLGQQIFQGIFLQDNISNMAHILGGIIGSFIGFLLNKKSRNLQ